MIKEVYTCIQSFLLGLGVVSFFIIGCNGFNLPFTDLIRNNVIIFCILFYIAVNIIIFLTYNHIYWQISVRACFIGTSCGLGIIISVLCDLSYKPFGWYVIVLSIFHLSEYIITAITNPATLSLDSFLLNHSVAYWVAAISSWIEFFLERWLLIEMKELWFISIIGVMICVFGEIMRKLAMITANTNFNHVVQVKRHKDHELVTWGIYRLCRHPSYVGWFWWSVGTQIILLNPICFIGYTLASWTFFNERVQFEEMTLIKFFGEKYIDYKKSVGTGLPFIKGYNINNLYKEM